MTNASKEVLQLIELVESLLSGGRGAALYRALVDLQDRGEQATALLAHEALHYLQDGDLHAGDPAYERKQRTRILKELERLKKLSAS